MIETWPARAYGQGNDYINEYLAEVAAGSTKTTDTEKDFIAQAVMVASEVVSKAVDMDDNVKNDRRGGCFVVGKKDSDWLPVPVFYGGAPKQDAEYGLKGDKYIVYALAKAATLAIHPEMNASKQNNLLPDEERLLISKNPVPGGAISLPDGTILAFSGFAEEVDEAICITTALKMNLIDEDAAREISALGTGKSFAIVQEFLG